MNKGYEKVKYILMARSSERRQQRIRLYYKNPKMCIQCNKPIDYDKRFNNKFCGSSCAALYNNKNRKKDKFCLNCKKLLINKHSKFCSSQCFTDWQYKKRVSLWLSGELSGLYGESVSTYVRKYLIETRGEKCEKCGWNKINPITEKVPLTINHIDGNYTHNSENNLELLCPNCHSLTPNYGSLNKGYGRINRRVKRRLCNRGVNGSTIGCQPISAGSIPADRSKE